MVFAIFLIFTIGLSIAIHSIRAVFTILPYISGLLGALILSFVFPGLKNIVPGEGKLSIFMLILAIEIVIGIFVNLPQTSGPMIVFCSMMFIGLAMIIICSDLEYNSWQKAVAVTILYLLSAGMILAANYESIGSIRTVARNMVTSIFVAFLYAMIIGINLLIILGYIWSGYVKTNFSNTTYEIFDNAGLGVIAIAMIVTAVLSFLRDRSEAKYERMAVVVDENSSNHI